MNEFHYINNKINDLLLEKNKKVYLKYFANFYRFDPSLLPSNKEFLHYDVDFGKALFSLARNPNQGKGNYTFLNHSYEPLEYTLDKQLYDYYCIPASKHRDFFVLHSEKNSKNLDLLKSKGLSFIHWFANGYVCSKHWFQNYEDIKIVTEYTPLQHKFICANRLIDDGRKYRIKFLNLINHNSGVYSLLDRDPYTGRLLEEIYPPNKVKPCSFDSHENSSAWIDLEGWNGTSFSIGTREVLTPSVWKSSFLHVVPETVINRCHLTEKIFKPIVLHQPFVLLNGSGGLEYLRSYGFKTFSEFWSEDYDNVENLDDRMQAVADIVNYIGDCSFKELEEMREKMKPILEYNYNWFYNGFADLCWKELQKNIKEINFR